jgi:hypothetical protein
MLLSKAVPLLDELWRKPANSAQDRRMGKIELPLGHHLDQITEAQVIAQVPGNMLGRYAFDLSDTVARGDLDRRAGSVRRHGSFVWLRLLALQSPRKVP